jgi:defect-in-organelle-trafficking protein DotB
MAKDHTAHGVAQFGHHVTDMPSLEDFLNHAVQQGASDIYLQSGHRPALKAGGVLKPFAPYKLQTDQVERIAAIVVGGSSLQAAIASGRDYDAAFHVADQHARNEFGVAKRLRFRLNATGIIGRDNNALQIVLRHIPADPPTLAEVGFPDELRSEIGLEQGAFFIAGETGSGKTTTFAACLRYILEGNTAITGNVLTYEAPIEYIFSDVASPGCIIAQSEIPSHLKSFADGLVNAMRRKPSLIVVGEMRDPQTIMAGNNAAITGHPVYATVHANNSAVILRRMVSLCDTSQQQQVFSDLAMNTRLLMSQTLMPKVGGGLICLRDWIVIDPDRGEELLDAGPSGHVRIMRQWMEDGDRARSMRRSATDALDAGHITRETAERTLKRYGYRD